VYTSFNGVIQVTLKRSRKLSTLSTEVNKTIKGLRVEDIEDHNLYKWGFVR
jgi:hypothetical protein